MQLGGASTRLRTPPYAGSHCAPPRRPGQPAGAGAPRPGPSPEIFGLLRAIRPPGPGGRPRGVRTPDDTLHRPLACRPGCRLVPACGKQEVDARRSADGQARSGGCWVKALHRSHLEAGDVTGAADLVQNPPQARQGRSGAEPQVVGGYSKPACMAIADLQGIIPPSG